MLTGGADGAVKLWGPSSAGGRLLKTFRPCGTTSHPAPRPTEPRGTEPPDGRTAPVVIEGIVYV